jgi:hypothetical protein
MSNRTAARSAKAARMHATGRLPLLRLFSTPLTHPSRFNIAVPRTEIQLQSGEHSSSDAVCKPNYA